MRSLRICISLLILQFLYSVNLFGQDIFQLIPQRKTEDIRALLEKKPESVSVKNQDGMTPLYLAVAYGIQDIVNLFIEYNADVNVRDNQGNPPLHYCAYSRSKAIAEILIAKGAEINVRNNSGVSPLQQAVSMGGRALAEYLVEQGAEVNAQGAEGVEMLQKAVENRITGLIDLLIEKGVSIEAEGENGDVLLHGAAVCGHSRLVELLLESGADTNSLNKKGGTFLHSSAEGGLNELIGSLIANNLDISARNYFGLTPLHKAASNGKTEVVDFLLSKGADINITSYDGSTPYHLAKENGRDEIAEQLISKGADGADRIFPSITGEYFGQSPPGMTPEIFAPGIVSKDNRQDFAGTFSPDGNEFFFTRRRIVRDQRVWYMKQIEGVWIEPQLAPFTFDIFEFEPHISPDGRKLFYGSRRPIPEEINSGGGIWYVEKVEGEWGQPNYLSPVINDVMPMYMSAASNGTLYYTNNSARGIYRSEFIDGEYSTPERLPDEINFLFAAHPYIAPDESYIIFDARPPDNLEKDPDIYISFKDQEGNWTKAVKIENGVSSSSNEIAASVSPDGKYLFFESNRAGSMDIYWVDFQIVEKYKN